jgi:hypothetical protein
MAITGGSKLGNLALELLGYRTGRTVSWDDLQGYTPLGVALRDQYLAVYRELLSAASE